MPTPDSRSSRVALVLLVVGSTFLSGCTEQEFRELMLTLAFGLLVIVIGGVVLSITNLVVLGGGIASLAINLFGTATHRSRTYGFVFGGLNIAAGFSGVVGSLTAMFVFHEQIRVALTPSGPSGSAGPEPDLVVTWIVALFVGLGAMALGAGCIAAAARAKAVDLVPRSEAAPPA